MVKKKKTKSSKLTFGGGGATPPTHMVYYKEFDSNTNKETEPVEKQKFTSLMEAENYLTARTRNMTEGIYKLSKDNRELIQQGILPNKTYTWFIEDVE